MHWTLAILNLLFLQSTHGINVGVGISDITGPAAEIGMVSTQIFVDLNIEEIKLFWILWKKKLRNLAHAYILLTLKLYNKAFFINLEYRIAIYLK